MKNERFPRSTLEAFGCDASNSNPISGPHREHHSSFKFVVVVILVFLAAMISIHLYAGGIDDRSSEFSRSELMKLDQRDDAHRQKAIKDCIEKRGAGVAPKIDSNDVVTGCEQRRKK